MTRAFLFRLTLAVVLMLSVIVLTVARVSYQFGRQNVRREYDALLDQIVLRELVKDCEALTKRLGRPPTDQAELESLLGRPLPVVHDGSLEAPVSYRSYGDHFQLQYELWATDDWIYDSARPDAGWVQHFY